MRYDYCPFARKDAPGEYHCIQPCCWFGGCEAPPRVIGGVLQQPQPIKKVQREMPKEMRHVPEPAVEEAPKKDVVRQNHLKLVLDAKVIMAKEPKLNQKQLSDKLGISSGTLRTLEKLYPGEISYERTTYKYNWDVLGPKIEELYAKGMSKADIRRQLVLPKRTLARYFNELRAQP